jgi:predicted NAD/FAD-binding protein
VRIAVIGSGIAGLVSAWLLSPRHEVVLFEADDRLGGHADTHDVAVDGHRHAVDTGFIVFNPEHYPVLTRLFAELRVESQATTMSFSVQSEPSRLEYGTGSVDALFCQPSNALRPRFLRMLADIARFYREAPALLDRDDDAVTLGAWLAANRYSDAFRDDHLVPMASALWSSPSACILDFPARHLVRFMANHCMLQLARRPVWRVVRGGSSTYVRAIASRWRVDTRVATPVTRVARDESGVDVESAGGRERFDHVVLACHADASLALLADPSAEEREVLGAFEFQDNDTVLHTDTSLLPAHRSAWSAWNAHVPSSASDDCTVSYCMNILQTIHAPATFVTTLNRTHAIDPAKILARRRYRHPLQSAASMAAQRRKAEIQGVRRTWYAGAWWGFGFHEDGARSGVDVAAALGVEWP